MKKKILIAGLALSFFCSFPSSVIAAEIDNTPLEVYASGHSTTRSDDIGYLYKTINGRLYKRLYNFTQEKWIGDWILVK